MNVPSRVNLLPMNLLVAVAVSCLVDLLSAQGGATITATAHVSGGKSDVSAPVNVSLDRFSTDTAREALMTALRSGGTAAARDLLRRLDPIGSIKVGTATAAIKYAYARRTGGGRLITAVTDTAIVHIGAGAPDAPPKAGFDLGLVLLDLPASGSGSGELVPAAKIRVDQQGAIVTDDYSDVVVRLSDVVAR